MFLGEKNVMNITCVYLESKCFKDDTYLESQLGELKQSEPQ